MHHNTNTLAQPQSMYSGWDIACAYIYMAVPKREREKRTQVAHIGTQLVSPPVKQQH